jgi:hypothetical protein
MGNSNSTHPEMKKVHFQRPDYLEPFLSPANKKAGIIYLTESTINPSPQKEN